jgi:hypothetical protein
MTANLIDSPSTAELKRVKPEFRLSEIVVEKAYEWQLQHNIRDDGSEHLCCRKCDQSVLTVVKPLEESFPGVDNRYVFTMSDLSSSLIAHLMICHGWTREVPGETS